MEARNPLGAIGVNELLLTKGKKEEEEEIRSPEPQDPLAGMSEADKWGFKGLRTLMNNYPDYNALVTGIDPSTLGFDLSSAEYATPVRA
jgi:CCR4-NOT transcription complex subunit 2